MAGVAGRHAVVAPLLRLQPLLLRPRGLLPLPLAELPLAARRVGALLLPEVVEARLEAPHHVGCDPSRELPPQVLPLLR